MILLQGMGTFVAIVGFAILLDTPGKYVLPAGLVGAVAGLVYLAGMEMNAGIVMASFLSAFSAGIVSHIFARLYKIPVLIFLLGGILPTVPGAGMYRIVYYIFQGDNTMTEYYLLETLKVAGMIALAVFLADSIFRLAEHDGWKQNSLQYVRREKSRDQDDGKSED